jgi:hypothetical protein
VALGSLALVGGDPTLALVAMGAWIGYLPWNLPRARIFMGDTGSLSLGVLLAALTLEVEPQANLPLAIGILAYPLGDLALVVLRRLIRAKPLMAPDKSHAHHKVAQLLGSGSVALPVLVAFAGLHAALALVRPGIWSLLASGCLWVGVAVTLFIAGRYRLTPILALRAPFQRVHAIRNYGLTTLRLATGPSQVEMILRHVTEALGLESLRIAGLEVKNRQPAGETSVWTEVLLHEAEAGWREAPQPRDPALDVERRTVIVELIRMADTRLQELAPLRATSWPLHARLTEEPRA